MMKRKVSLYGNDYQFLLWNRYPEEESWALLTFSHLQEASFFLQNANRQGSELRYLLQDLGISLSFGYSATRNSLMQLAQLLLNGRVKVYKRQGVRPVFSHTVSHLASTTETQAPPPQPAKTPPPPKSLGARPTDPPAVKRTLVKPADAPESAKNNGKTTEAAAQPPVNKTWIEIQLIGEDDKPIANEKYRIELPDGSFKEGSLNGQGLARVDNIDKGLCKISFPELDQEAWEAL